MLRILTNNIGYDSSCAKKAILQSDEPITVKGFCLVREKDGRKVYEGTARKSDPVARWNKGDYWVLRFDEFSPDSDRYYGAYYVIEVETSAGAVRSAPFEIYKNVIEFSTLSSVVYYFKAQRDSGEWENADKKLGFNGGREGVFDLHGGWFDATGDVGIHLTHQSHTSYFNPQQGSFSAYVFFRIYELLEQSNNEFYSMLRRRVLDEGIFGADWLMRMRAPSKSFFKTINRIDAFNPIQSFRKIGFEYKGSSAQFGAAETADTEVITDENYETSFRSGGGYAIAALAAAARHPYPGSWHTSLEYLEAAKESYLYLEKNNERYTNDGKWNLVDEFCALDALVELYKSSGEIGFLFRARDMAQRIIKKFVPVDGNSGYFSVNGTDRPYFSATDEGTPVIALLNYHRIEMDGALRKNALDTAIKVMRFALDITNEVSNPFGYARIFAQDKSGKKTKQFFFPHHTEMEPWWQGDNARILSLAAAARYTASVLDNDGDLAARLRAYADDQISWVLGLNPYDSCMLEGSGRHNIDYYFKYRYDFIGCPGGIVNGITGGIDDEEGIEFIMTPEDNETIVDNWRWAEQWLPHASWYLYALAIKKL
jgi:hypothetical protein